MNVDNLIKYGNFRINIFIGDNIDAIESYIFDLELRGSNCFIILGYKN